MLAPATRMGLVRVIVPPTANTQVRGPVFSMQARRLPVPASLRLVTLMTVPPRPPTALAPKPSALGNALIWAWPTGGCQQATVSSTATISDDALMRLPLDPSAWPAPFVLALLARCRYARAAIAALPWKRGGVPGGASACGALPSSGSAPARPAAPPWWFAPMSQLH